MTTRHRVAYLAMLALALAALGCYVVTGAMDVLELTHPALGATSGVCFICMSPWVQAEFLIGLVAVLLVLVVELAGPGTSLARRDVRWLLAFLALLALAIGFAALAFSGAADAITARLGVNIRNALLLGAAAYVLLTPLLALFYSRYLRLAWTPDDIGPAPSGPTRPPPPAP